MCLAAVKQDQGPFEDLDGAEDDIEDDDQSEANDVSEDEEKSNNSTQTSRDANDNFTDRDAINTNVTGLMGTYIEWFVMPTPAHPNGYRNRINFDKTMVAFLASLSEQDNLVAEEQMVHGDKLGLEQMEVFRQIVLAKRLKPLRRYQERAADPNTYAADLQIAASRHHAAIPQAFESVGIAMCEDSRLERLNKDGDWLLLGKGEDKLIGVPADCAHALGLEEQEKDGEHEVVFFDSDTIANMKYLCLNEKETYKDMLARDVFERRYPGKTMAKVAADRKKRRVLAKAAKEEMSAELNSTTDDMASMNLGQQ